MISCRRSSWLSEDNMSSIPHLLHCLLNRGCHVGGRCGRQWNGSRGGRRNIILAPRKAIREEGLLKGISKHLSSIPVVAHVYHPSIRGGVKRVRQHGLSYAVSKCAPSVIPISKPQIAHHRRSSWGWHSHPIVHWGSVWASIWASVWGSVLGWRHIPEVCRQERVSWVVSLHDSFCF